MIYTEQPLRKIFDDITNNHESGKLVAFGKMEKTMFYHRSKYIPKLPKSFAELGELLSEIGDMGGHPFYRLSDCSMFGNFVIFASNLQLKLMNDAKIVSVDATFKVVPSRPKNFYQLFVICGKAYGHFHPLMYVLMTNKRTNLYTKIFEKIKQIVPDFEPDTFLCDFEFGLIKALKQSFVNSAIHGCWFHFTQAVLRRIGSDGNKNLYIKSPEFKSIAKRLFSLTLLPPTKIVPAFNRIKQECLKFPFYQLTEDLFTYIESFWINSVGCPTISVHGNSSRTNNGQEALNAKLKVKIGVHPNFIVFLGRLKAFTTSMGLDYERLKLNKQISRNKKRSTVEKSTAIRNANQLLENGDINEHEFIEMVSNTIDSLVDTDLMLYDIESPTPTINKSVSKKRMMVSIPRMIIDSLNDNYNLCSQIIIRDSDAALSSTDFDPVIKKCFTNK